MRIVTARRISQAFFLLLFFWFCIVTNFGIEWWQLRGWPVNWFLQLDPLIAIGTILTTSTLYSGLAWALVTIVLTIILGRFFCGWLCPFGTMHHLVGYFGWRGKPVSQRINRNQYHPAQSIKYTILIVLLSAAGGVLLARFISAVYESWVHLLTLIIASIAAAGIVVLKSEPKKRRSRGVFLFLIVAWTLLSLIFSVQGMLNASLQTGLLDPISLVYRSINLILIPLADSSHHLLFTNQRFYDGEWLIGLLFLAALLLNLKTPRFYCRFVCPLGALQGVLASYAPWRVGKTCRDCIECKLCEKTCEGACEPTAQIRLNECVLCMNCLDDCKHGVMGYQSRPSFSGEITAPDISRRSLVLGITAGVVAVPLLRLEGGTGNNWDPTLIRPPGALPEEEFLKRCIKCGQCMRVCPTNIIHPLSTKGGFEALWTPTLNFRIGTSGCQLNCVACGHICPTAAIRPISIEEKLGRSQYAKSGPIRLGTAFVDQGRCLPWAMDKPCIVCQENCPVSPKAIFVREHFISVRGGVLKVRNADQTQVEIIGDSIRAGRFSTGDYFMRIQSEAEEVRRLIVESSDRILRIEPRRPFKNPPVAGSTIEVQVRLQRPQIQPERCTGCGVCEHECPVSGQRAIRVTAENESREKKHSLL